jgi:hypothetical protein
VSSLVRDIAVLEAIPPETLSAEIHKPERMAAYFSAIDRGLAKECPSTRTAMNIMAHAYGMLKNTDVNIALIIQQHGIASADDLARVISSGKRLEQLAANTAQSLETARDDALDILKLALREHPEWRGAIAHELGLTSANGKAA